MIYFQALKTRNKQSIGVTSSKGDVREKSTTTISFIFIYKKIKESGAAANMADFRHKATILEVLTFLIEKVNKIFLQAFVHFFIVI